MRDQVVRWGLCLLLLPTAPLYAGSALDERVARLERLHAEQQRRLEMQQRQLEAQAGVIAVQNRALRDQSERLGLLNESVVNANDLSRWRGAGSSDRVAADAPAEAPSRQPVGVAPPPKPAVSAPKVVALAELGGVLTPQGQLVIEPSLQFSNSQVNRLTFVGIEILEAFQIGLLEAQDADRNLASFALAARYGVTNRLELEAKLPYIYRSDRLAATIPSVSGDPEITRDLSGSGIGDLELALHYQLNAGREGWPIFVGNLRYKSTTGEGPFEVARTTDGLETELATGSGFHSLEPSVTMLYPSDPAVFYANVGYLFNISRDVNKTFGDQTIGHVDPGDAVRISVGMGYSINQRASFSIGYKHDFIQETHTEINGVTLTSTGLDVGALLLGYGFQLNKRTALNLNFELGVTADAPDVVVTLRAPFQW